MPRKPCSHAFIDSAIHLSQLVANIWHQTLHRPFPQFSNSPHPSPLSGLRYRSDPCSYVLAMGYETGRSVICLACNERASIEDYTDTRAKRGRKEGRKENILRPCFGDVWRCLEGSIALELMVTTPYKGQTKRRDRHMENLYSFTLRIYIWNCRQYCTHLLWTTSILIIEVYYRT